MSYTMSCAYDIMCFVYDILYDIFTDSAWFKCCPVPAQIQPDSDLNLRFKFNRPHTRRRAQHTPSHSMSLVCSLN